MTTATAPETRAQRERREAREETVLRQLRAVEVMERAAEHQASRARLHIARLTEWRDALRAVRAEIQTDLDALQPDDADTAPLRGALREGLDCIDRGPVHFGALLDVPGVVEDGLRAHGVELERGAATVWATDGRFGLRTTERLLAEREAELSAAESDLQRAAEQRQQVEAEARELGVLEVSE